VNNVEKAYNNSNVTFNDDAGKPIIGS